MKAIWTKGITSVQFKKLRFGYELHLWTEYKWPEVSPSYQWHPEECWTQYDFLWWNYDGDDVERTESIKLMGSEIKDHIEFYRIEKDTFHCIWIPSEDFNGGNEIKLQ